MPQTGLQICAACAEVAIMPGHNEPHRHMQIVDQKCARDNGYDTVYRCMECDTLWICHTDKWGFNGAFMLKSGARWQPPIDH